jgi:FkbM family methyltransferase
VLDRIKRRLLRRHGDVRFVIGDVELELPPQHRLPKHRALFALYDVPLGDVARSVVELDEAALGVDIGANVGDSAAVIRSACAMPLVCIEADPLYFEYLRRNAERIGGLTLINAAVGLDDRTVAGEIRREGGTAAIVDGTLPLRTRRLPDLLTDAGVDVQRVKLVKIDTDGYDFDVLMGSRDILESHRPSLFFEYLVTGERSLAESVAVVRLLDSYGYRFIVYDNYGNTLAAVTRDVPERMAEISRFLLSSQTNGGGVGYADIFATVDDELFALVARRGEARAMGKRAADV